MTVAEFFGCAALAFGPPLAMFVFTIVHDPIRIIIMIAAAFFWLVSLLASSIVWFVVIPLRGYLVFGGFVAVVIQEAFRYWIWKILRKTERGLQEVADNVRVTDNKHILAYVSGVGFGIISGAFALVNVLADAAGPATMGLKSGSDAFFLTSATQALCMILLHTFWTVIFFNALDVSKYSHVAFVVLTHLLVSGLTLFNVHGLYYASLIPNIGVTMLTGVLAYRVVGGTSISFKHFVMCK